MEFKFLNDTICDVPRLVVIVDDTNKSLEETTKAVFPAARICLDTMNQRNRMIVLIDHATEEVKKVARDFFMQPDSNTTVKVVAMPYTEALHAEKTAEDESLAKDNLPADVQPCDKPQETVTPQEPVTAPVQKQEENQQSAADQAAEQTKPAEAEKTSDADTAAPTEKKPVRQQDLLWGKDEAFDKIWAEADARIRMIKKVMRPEDNADKFLELMNRDAEQRGQKMTFLLQLKWFDAIGCYSKSVCSQGAFLAASRISKDILHKKNLLDNGRTCLQNAPGLTFRILSTIRREQNAETFAEYFDRLSAEDQKKLTEQIFDEVSFKYIEKQKEV